MPESGGSKSHSITHNYARHNLEIIWDKKIDGKSAGQKLIGLF
jgi:hypothetical protein